MAAQLMATKGSSGADSWWTAWATISFPVPVSPSRSTLAGVWATCAMALMTSSMALLRPMIWFGL